MVITKDDCQLQFEIIDWNDYKDGDVISLNSERRKNVIFQWMKNDDEYKQVAEMINGYLKEHYRRK